MFIKTFLVAVGFLLIAIIGIAIRVILKKDKEFRGTCASNNPLVLKSDGSCSYCGKKDPKECENENK